MWRRRIIECTILGLYLLIVVVLIFKKDHSIDHNLPTVPILNLPVQEKQEVRRVSVLRGDFFDLTLKDDSHVLAKLSVNAIDEAKAKVLTLLNHCTNPKIVLREKQSDGHWTIDFFVTENNQEINITEWLISNNLVYK